MRKVILSMMMSPRSRDIVRSAGSRGLMILPRQRRVVFTRALLRRSPDFREVV